MFLARKINRVSIFLVYALTKAINKFDNDNVNNVLKEID